MGVYELYNQLPQLNRGRTFFLHRNSIHLTFKVVIMKKLYSLLVVLLIGFVGNAQIVNIPDANFKARLLQADVTNQIARDVDFHFIKIDENGDGEI